MPRSNTGAGPGHMKSRYGAKRVIFNFFSPGPRPGHVKSGYGANGLFLSFSALVQYRAGPGHVKNRRGANG